MLMKEHHLPISRDMNFIIMNDATYYRSRMPNASAFSSFSI
ncbi:Pregnancy zone [Gossypium arboreum]|uniref:Pregnancy zone n=1 Tax=Gossypium arboreum TaxID=29729 RepID=A0A0B0NCQ5_GOSAR|nr:Pregnancy zone [Gossypium arboreum]